MSQQQLSVVCRNFSARLKEMRGDKAQVYFAKQLGINHQQTYQRYESGTVPNGEVLHQIAVRLGTTVDWLLSDGTTPSSKALTPDALSDRLEDSNHAVRDLADEQLDDLIAYNNQQLKSCKAGGEAMFVEMAALAYSEKTERLLNENPNIDRARAYKVLIKFFEQMAAHAELRDSRKPESK